MKIIKMIKRHKELDRKELYQVRGMGMSVLIPSGITIGFISVMYFALKTKNRVKRELHRPYYRVGSRVFIDLGWRKLKIVGS